MKKSKYMYSKTIKSLFLFSLIALLFSCGGSQNVIMDSGKVYTVKNDEFFTGEKNVTDDLTSQQKRDIKSVLQDRLQAEEQNAQELKTLNGEIKSLKNQINTLEKKVEIIEDKQRNLEKARAAYINAKLNLINKEQEFEKLKSKNSLSDKEQINFQKEILELKEKVINLKKDLEAIR